MDSDNAQLEEAIKVLDKRSEAWNLETSAAYALIKVHLAKFLESTQLAVSLEVIHKILVEYAHKDYESAPRILAMIAPHFEFIRARVIAPIPDPSLRQVLMIQKVFAAVLQELLEETNNHGVHSTFVRRLELAANLNTIISKKVQ